MHFIELVTAHGIIGFLIEITIKGTIILASAGLAAALLKSASASVRHLVWSTALVLLLALPGFVAFAPSYDVAVLPPEMESLTLSDPVTPQRMTDAIIADSPSHLPRASVNERIRTPDPAVETVSPQASATTIPGRQAVVRSSAVPVASAPFDWRVALFSLWVIGAFLVSLRYALGWMALRRIQKRAVPVGDVRLRLLVKRMAASMGVRRRMRLVWGGEGSMPLTFGCLEPTVLLPEGAREWEPERLMVVLKHELAHVKRWDCLVQAIVYVACILYWFNPIVWIAAAQSHREREMACDDYVLSSGSRGSDYAGHLLEIARSLQGPRHSGLTTIAMARRSELEGRLLAILSPNRKREKTTAQNVLATFAVLGCLVMTVAALKPVAMQTPDPPEAATVAASPDATSEATLDARAVRSERRRARAVATSPSRSERPSVEASVRIDEQYVAEASAVVAKAAATLEASLNRLIPKSVRLNGSVAAKIDDSISLVADGRLEIVRPDTIPLEQIRRLRNAGVDVDYIEEMASIGFDRLTVEQLISLAHAGVDASYVRSMRDAGFENLDPEDLIDLGFAGVDAEDVQVWADLGYSDLTSRQLIKLEHAGVDAADVRALAEAGYGDLSPAELVKFGHANVDPEFIASMRALGFTDLSSRELIRLSHADVDVEFVKEMRKAGYADLSAEDLIRLSHADVDPHFIQRMAEMGLTNLSADELVQLGHADVDVEFMAEMKASGYESLIAGDLVALSHADVDAQFIRDLGEMGLKDLSVPDLIKLGHADVDASFIREMRATGYENLSVDELIQLGYADVDPDYIADLARAGVTGLSPMDLVQLSHADIDAHVIADLAKAGLDNLSASDLIQLGYADVDGQYISEMASVGLTGLSASDLTMLAHAGVTSDDVRQMRELGVKTNDPEKIVQFKYMDIDSDYVERIRRALDK